MAQQRPTLDIVATEALIARVLTGDTPAFARLGAEISPEVEEAVRGSKKMGPLRHSAEHARNVVAAVLTKLSADSYHELAEYAPWREAHPDKTLGDWLRTVTLEVIHAYVERQPA
jgi:hypothetical protein